MYTVIHRLLRWLFRRYFNWNIEGFHHFPADGPVIVVSNHIHYLDPLAIGAVSSRKLHFMAKEELFANPVAGWFLRRLGAFPVRRGRSDRKAIRHALHVLHTGRVLAMFPEGTRSPTGELMEFQRGAALLALKSGAPVLPMIIEGALNGLREGRKIPHRGERLTVRIGPVLRFEPGAKIDQATVTDVSQSIHAAMEALYETEEQTPPPRTVPGRSPTAP